MRRLPNSLCLAWNLQARKADVIREVIEFIRGKGRHYNRQWWPHLARLDASRKNGQTLWMKRFRQFLITWQWGGIW
jgi:hypothetical protein